ncbi:MAG: DUF4365 domain-containing protein [Flavobacteriaceae bacterium]|nr:DUF4365 domain-containing protein [Flavobacteriaceae bacterium]
MEHDPEHIFLPKSSPQQELETISKKAFERLFDETRFVLKSEVIDNGIDYRCELKKVGTILGFGFNFQLKGKGRAKANSDGSFSKSIKTSNIEYLINNGLPAYYGFYIHETTTIFYESLDDFVAKLERKNKKWQKQQNHTLHFSKVLDAGAIETIYKGALEKGIMYRRVNMSIMNWNNTVTFGDSIVIDRNLEVKSDWEVHKTIENIGFSLIDQCRWSEVLELHQTTSVGKKESPKYKLIVGVANYYQGHLYKALDYFRESKKEEDRLEVSEKNHLIFMESSTKRVLGIIDEETYQKILSTLGSHGHLKYQIQIDKAVKELKPLRFSSQNLRSEAFEAAIQNMLQSSEPTSTQWYRLQSEWWIYSYQVVLSKYCKYICDLNAFESLNGVDMDLREQISSELTMDFKALDLEIVNLMNDLSSNGKGFAFYYLFTYKTKLEFEKMVNAQLLIPVKDPKWDIPDYSKEYDKSLLDIELCMAYFNRIGHIENEIFAKSIRYELLHYQGRLEEAEISITKLEQLCNILDIEDLKKRVDYVKNGGTNHQLLSKSLRPLEEYESEIARLIKELQEYDRKEECLQVNNQNIYQIDLFPIGYFSVPMDKVDLLSEIFSFGDGMVLQQIKKMFKMGIIPVINTYVHPVVKEGPLKGNLECKGVDSYKNMYNARKAFFEHGFYRVRHE